MRSVYLDSNVVFRLGSDEPLLQRLVEAQRHRHARVVVGWTTIWEIAGAFSRKPEAIDKARSDAQIVLRLIDSGGRLARSVWNVAIEMLSRAPSPRCRPSVILDPVSTEHMAAAASVRAIADPARGEETRRWYERYTGLAEEFNGAEREFLGEVLSKSQHSRPQLLHGLTASLDDLEYRGWLGEATAKFAEKLGFRGRRPKSVASDWFGPVGRMMRASIALSMLHGATRGKEKARPKYSDYADVMHVVTAGIVGRFVTADETARHVFHATWPTNSRTAMVFPGDWRRFLESRPL
jgi:hypothetical protein